MIPDFDIFRKDAAGNLIWIEAVRTHEDAKARILELATRAPGEYLVFNRNTGGKLAIRADARGTSGQSNP